MTLNFDKLQAIAKEDKAITVKQLRNGAINELLAMAEYIAECNEYPGFIDYDELHAEILNAKIDDMADFFNDWQYNENERGRLYGVCFIEYGHPDNTHEKQELTNNGSGFDFGDALSIAGQLQAQGHWAIVYTLADYEITA